MKYHYAVRNIDTSDTDICLYTNYADAIAAYDIRKDYGINAEIQERDEWDHEVMEHAAEMSSRRLDEDLERGRWIGYRWPE